MFWCTLNSTMLGDQWPGIEQFKIETVELTDTQVVTQTEAHYFDVSAMMSDRAVSQTAPVIVHRDVSGLILPYEIGWVHFDTATDNEPQARGLGVTLQYSAPHLKCSVYIYDREYSHIPDDLNDELVREEFEAAQRDVMSVNPDFTPWPDRPARQDSLERYYRVGDDAREASLLLLTTARRRFIKARLTWSREPVIDRIALQSVDRLITVTRRLWNVPSWH